MATASLAQIYPSFTPCPGVPESSALQSIIKSLSLLPHIEGGYYVETDRAVDTVPSPFPPSIPNPHAPVRPGYDPAVRNNSTTIFYLLTPSGPQGGFHRNLARTVHTLHFGRGRYVLIHEDGFIESFIVGKDISKGEKLQWIVEGGKYKASYLLPDFNDESKQSNGLLISETVIPGFEFCDHDFLTREGLQALVGEDKARVSEWLLSPLAVTE